MLSLIHIYGFTFGKQKDIYNPWSIINFLENKKIDTYWADTSSNSLIDHLMKKSVPEIKELMELLLKRESIEVTFDEMCIRDSTSRYNPCIDG